MAIIFLPGISDPSPSQNRNSPAESGIREQTKADGLIEEAFKHFQEGEKKEAFRTADRAIAILINVGADLLNAGEFYGAQGIFERLLEVQKQLSRTDHPSTAFAYTQLSTIYQRQGNYTDEWKAKERALAVYEKLYRPNHPELAIVLDNIASTRREHGDLEGALKASQRALNIFEEMYGPHHRDVAITLDNIAATYRAQGNLNGALRASQRAFKIFKQTFGLYHPDVAIALDSIATTLKAKGDLTRALEARQKELLISEKLNGSFDPKVADTLVKITDILEAKGDLDQAITISKRIAIIYENIHGTNHRTVAEALDKVGLLFYERGNLAEALRYNRQVLNIVTRISDSRHPDVADILHNIGKILQNQGNFDESFEHLQQAFDVAKVGYGPSHPTTTKIQADLEVIAGQLRQLSRGTKTSSSVINFREQCKEGIRLHKQGIDDEALPLLEAGFSGGEEANFANTEELGFCALHLGLIHFKNDTRALEAFEVALKSFRQNKNRTGEATTLHNMGGVHLLQKRYEVALGYFKKALVIQREIADGPGEENTMHNLQTIASLQNYRAADLFESGNYDEALELFLQILSIWRELGDRKQEGITLSNIGNVYFMQARYGETEAMLHQALEIMGEFGNEKKETGLILGLMGRVYTQQGLNPQAWETLNKALSIIREANYKYGESIIIHDLGEIAMRLDLFDKALNLFLEAYAIAKAVKDRRGEGATLNSVGNSYVRLDKFDEALESYRQALVIRRELKDRVGEGSTLANMGLVLARQGKYVQALQFLQEALEIDQEIDGPLEEAETYFGIGYVYERQEKTRLALDAYENAMTRFEFVRELAGHEFGRAGFIERYISVYDAAIRLYRIEGRLEQAFFTSERARSRAFLDTLASGRVRLPNTGNPETGLAAFSARSKGLEDLLAEGSSVLSVREVQEKLDTNTTLVSYHMLRQIEENRATCYAFVITRNSFSVVELPNAIPDNLIEAIREVYGLPAAANGYSDPPKEESKTINGRAPGGSGTSAGKTYLRPLQRLNNWLIAPIANRLHTQNIGIIPHLLLHYVPFSALHDGTSYFSENKTLFVLPSASALPYIEANATKSQSQESSKATAVVFGNPETNIQWGLRPLTHAELEAEDVGKFLGVKAYTAEQATETRLRSLVGQANILHLAAHGSYSETFPLRSALFLAPSDTQDGRLEVQEVYELDLEGTEVVVLSACETALGKLSQGNELVGLTQAFFFAGTPTVIASLWRVNDKATKELMVGFYRYWRQKGMNKAEALQTAQADIRKRYPHPYYWAPFILNGDPGRSTLSKSHSAAP